MDPVGQRAGSVGEHIRVATDVQGRMCVKERTAVVIQSRQLCCPEGAFQHREEHRQIQDVADCVVDLLRSQVCCRPVARTHGSFCENYAQVTEDELLQAVASFGAAGSSSFDATFVQRIDAGRAPHARTMKRRSNGSW